MTDIRISLSSELKDLVKARSEELNLSSSEYFRMLVDLDISLQRYQCLATYVNVLYNRINDLQNKLGVHATPLQEVPFIKLDSV